MFVDTFGRLCYSPRCWRLATRPKKAGDQPTGTAVFLAVAHFRVRASVALSRKFFCTGFVGTTHCGQRFMLLPATGYSSRSCRATVAANQALCDQHRRLALVVNSPFEASPGQFVQVRCYGMEGGRAPFLRRPFSLADVRIGDNNAEVELIYKVVGGGTSWMARLQPGDDVDFLGPLGHPFVPIAGVSLHIVAGGGVGLPPIMWLARAIARNGAPVVAVASAKTRAALPLTIETGPVAEASPDGLAYVRAREFGPVPVLVTTDDGSCGLKGTSLDGVVRLLLAKGLPGADVAVYACGPEAMLRAIARHTTTAGIRCQVCMERMMGCGMGTCQSCVVGVRDESAAAGWRYRLCCTDGPVFQADEILW